MPHIVDACCYVPANCFAGHRDDHVQVAEPPTSNEGNFIAILRLLAESNPQLREHLISGPENARHTSKTVQNEVIGVIADMIREYFRKYIEKNPQFALIPMKRLIRDVKCCQCVSVCLTSLLTHPTQ